MVVVLLVNMLCVNVLLCVSVMCWYSVSVYVLCFVLCLCSILCCVNDLNMCGCFGLMSMLVFIV